VEANDDSYWFSAPRFHWRTSTPSDKELGSIRSTSTAIETTFNPSSWRGFDDDNSRLREVIPMAGSTRHAWKSTGSSPNLYLPESTRSIRLGSINRVIAGNSCIR